MQHPYLTRVALAALLGTTALLGPVEHVFAQDAAGAVAVPAADTGTPATVVVPAPAEGQQTIILQDGGAMSVLVVPAGGTGSLALAPGNAAAEGDDPPLNNPFTLETPVTTALPWDMAPPSTTNVLASDNPPLDNPSGPGSDFPNNPWVGPAGS